jgi:alpha-amylase
MSGTNAALGATDANDIPNRSAFEWYKSDQGKGMAYWYKVKGPWRNTFNNDVPNDGISLEEEQNDPNSLWNFYRKMIGIRKAHPEISNGTYQTLTNNSEKVFSFMRSQGNKQLIVAANLSDKTVDVSINLKDEAGLPHLIYGKSKSDISVNSILATLPAYGIEVFSR